MTFGDLDKLPEMLASLEKRIEALEKENEKQLEERPKGLELPLTMLKFENPAINVNRLSQEQIEQITDYLAREVEDRGLTIHIPW